MSSNGWFYFGHEIMLGLFCLFLAIELSPFFVVAVLPAAYFAYRIWKEEHNE